MVLAAARETAEQEVVELLLPQLARFLAREVRSDAIDADASIPARVRAGAGELGLFGLTIPQSHGGYGLSLGATCRIVSEIARVDRSVAIMIGLHAGLGTRGLVEHGQADLARRWLPRLASGECIASFAATEASAGSDLASVRTTGEVVREGLRVQGEKSYVTNGGYAGLFTVLARTPGFGGERAHAVVCIPADAPGVHVGREEHKLGIRGTSTVTVRFDDVVVPMSHVLGTPGQGMDLTHGLLGWGRTLMSAGCVGTARAALDAAVGHAKTRRQFGRPIGEFGATRAHLAWMAARVHAMQALVESVAERHARGESIESESAVAKVFCSDSAFEVCDRSLQLHGALGFIESTGVARMLRDCRITRIFEGANDVLLVRIGASRLASRSHGGLDVTPLDARLDAAVADVRKRFGVSAVRRQVVLQRLARAEIAACVARAVAAHEGDRVLSEHAIETAVREGVRCLEDLANADRDEDSAAKLADRLYAR